MQIYLITNLANGKTYVGQTIQKLTLRWAQHIADAKRGRGHALCRAILEYGEQGFTMESLCVCPDRESMSAAERFFIKFTASSRPTFGYNITLGGEGSNHNADAKARMRAAKLGRPQSVEHRKKISAALKANHFIRTIPVHDEAWRARVSARLKGRPFSAQHRSRLSAAATLRERLKREAMA